MIRKNAFILSALFLFMITMGCRNTPPRLSCTIDIEVLKESIKTMTNADTVLIYTKILREDICFSRIITPVIIIENATTQTLDFKTLSIAEYQRFDNFNEINNELKREAYTIAMQVIDNCDMNNFNDLIIEFIKKDILGEPMYRFICHYDEFIPKKEPKELVCSINLELLKGEIKSATNADTVLIHTQKFEIYLHEIIGPVIVIENGTTKSLDFKILPTDKYQGFGSYDNYAEISDNLQKEGYVLLSN